MKSIFKNEILNILEDSLEKYLEDMEGSFQKDIMKGKSIEVEGRTIYPVIQVLTLEVNDKFVYEYITPLAIAVIESDNRYFISFDEENQDLTELLNEDGIWDELGL
jgi:hypothetical protein